MSSIDSRTRHANSRIILGALLGFSFAATVPVRRAMERSADSFSQNAGLFYVSSGETLRSFSMGYEGLLADVYWTRAVQYFGRNRIAGEGNFELLGSLLSVATALDPHLLIAYRFGAVFLAEKRPGGAGDAQEALHLLRRGIVANPDYWRLWQDVGFIYYWDLHDYSSAARAFETGSRMPGAATWMKTTAAAIAAKGGGFEMSRALWSQIYRQAENESIRNSALNHLRALRAQRDITELDALLEEYERRERRAARAMPDLVRVGFIAGVPVDPSGVPYAVARNGRAGLGSASTINLELVR